ncbi:MAG: YkgJ family cysteine cluster protein [Phycisphaerae bacterium]
MAKEKWYAAGLAFECTQCGNCCSGDPGYVWLTKEEIRRIAAFLGRDDEWLPKSQLRRVGFRYSLTEKSDGDCIFLKREGNKAMCGIYPVRPNQCRTWPFWTEVLRDPDTWNAVAMDCPGMNRGPSHDFVQIETRRLQKEW